METLVISGVALAALAYLGRRLYLSFRAARTDEPGCPSCGSCPGSAIGPAGENTSHPERSPTE
jgi:hypothetical protein